MLVPTETETLIISNLLLVSVAFNCGDPGVPTNGRLWLTNSTAVNYTCDSGYRLSGARTRHCTANGEWTERVPVCHQICKHDHNRSRIYATEVVYRSYRPTYHIIYNNIIFYGECSTDKPFA